MRPTWEKAKDLLAEFDGVATEIFVVGIPISQLRTVMEVLGALPALEVLSYKNDSMESAEPFDASWRARFETRPGINCQHSLRSANGTAHHLQVYLWLHEEQGLLEVELVFWNDITFPPGLEVQEYENRLQSLVNIAEGCRVGASGAQCLLAPEHNGPVEELAHNENVICW